MARLHLQPTNRSPTFDSLQLRTGAPAGIITTIGSEVAVVVFASPARFDDSICFHLCSIGAPRLPPRIAARRPGASGWRSRWPWRRSRAVAIFGRLERPAGARPEAQATLRGLPTACALHSLAAEKKCARERSFLAILACLSACKLASKAPQAPATCRCAARAIGPRTQSITTLPTGTDPYPSRP